MTTSIDLALALDPVVFAQQLGLTLDDWQAKLARSTSKRVLVNASRQSGKSSTSALIALWTALYQPNSLVLMVSPSLRQSGELFKKSLDMYRAMGRPVASEVENRLSLELENKSRIISLPGTEATIRGMSGAALLLLDEASRVDDDLLAAVRPMLATSGGRLIALSTPNGPIGWWYKAWIKEQGWERYEIPATMCPRISPEFLAEERATLGAISFAREYMCSFETPEGALWKPEWIEETRVVAHPDLVRAVVSIDPAVTAEEGSAETGMIVAGIGDDGHGYVLADKSLRASPNEWAQTAIAAYDLYEGDRIVGEVNNGGDLVESVIQNVAKEQHRRVPFKAVHASRGKLTRAEPVAALYERGFIHHVGTFPDLEKQLLTWIQGDKSPDRLDALVWAFTELIVSRSQRPGLYDLDQQTEEEKQQAEEEAKKPVNIFAWAEMHEGGWDE